MENETFETVDLMAQNERLIRDLYATFVKRFAEYRDFWETISEEEDFHGNSIDLFIKEAREGGVHIDLKRFNKSAIEYYMDYIRRKTKEVEGAYFPLHKDALSLSLGIEQTLIEKNFFEVFETDNDALKNVLNLLRESTLDHIERIKKELAKN